MKVLFGENHLSESSVLGLYALDCGESTVLFGLNHLAGDSTVGLNHFCGELITILSFFVDVDLLTASDSGMFVFFTSDSDW